MNIKTVNETILSLYNKLNTKEINLNPIYQRTEGVWVIDDQRLLINSIIDNFPIPNLFFHQMHEFGNGKFDCVDGKQRLTTIRNFIEGRITVDINGNEYEYTNLPSKYRKNFDGRKIGVHIISKTSDREIKIVFDRLQRGANLTPSEILKTLDSEFNKKVQNFMDRFSFLTPNMDGKVKLGIRDGNKRSDIFGLVLKIFVLEIEKSDIKTKNIEIFLYKFNKILPEHKDKVRKIEQIFQFFQDHLSDQDFSKIKSQYGFVSIYYLLSIIFDKHGEPTVLHLLPFIKDFINALSINKKDVTEDLKKFIKIKEISQEGWDTKPKILERNNILLSIINDEGIVPELIVDDSYILYNFKNYTDEIYNTINELVKHNIGYRPEVLANYPAKFNELKENISDFGKFRLFISDSYTIMYESYDESKLSILEDNFKKKNNTSILYWLNEFRTFLHHNPNDDQGGRFEDKDTRDQAITKYVNDLGIGINILNFDELSNISLPNLCKLKNHILNEFKKLTKDMLSKNNT